MKTQVDHHAFSEFYHNWFLKLQHILHNLMQVDISKQSNHDDQQHHLQPLISTVTTHLKEYYTLKWASAREDVLPFFSPTWLTPMESAYSSWLTGWKPSAAFRLLYSLSGDPTTALTEDQRRKIELLRMKVRMDEEKVEREMERLQVAIADRKMAELAKVSCRLRHGQGGAAAEGMVEVALRGIMGGLEKVMKSADCVRLKALKGMLDVLTPLQCVQFLSATLSLYLRLRQCGGVNTHTDAPPKLNN